MAEIKVAIDAMGGDHGLPVTVSGALLALKYYPEVKLIFVGDHDLISTELSRLGVLDNHQLEIHHASQHVAMDESPASALRTKKDSSMRVAIDLVASGKALACASAGNTGALMATAKFVLKTIPGIDRPAILGLFPPQNPSGNGTYVLDLGANVDCSAENLLQFAIMGSVAVGAIKNLAKPTIGLLNIGHEAIKGNEFVKKAAQLLQNCAAINYYGFVEADKITTDLVDVVVCDGFTGNVALKAMEGSARLVAAYLRKALSRNFFTKLAAFCISPILHDFKHRIDPSCYNGASLIGLRGIVIKSHGGANAKAFSFAVKRAIEEAQYNVPSRISEEVKKLLSHE